MREGESRSEERKCDVDRERTAPRDGQREARGLRTRDQLLALVRGGFHVEGADRPALMRLRDELLMALTLERDRITRELLPNPLTRDEFDELDDFYRRVIARLTGN